MVESGGYTGGDSSSPITDSSPSPLHREPVYNQLIYGSRSPDALSLHHHHQQQQSYQHQRVGGGNRTTPGSSSSSTTTTTTSAASLFTIDSILAPRPMGNVPAAAAAAAASLQAAMQGGEGSTGVRNAAAAAAAAAGIHPLQQQLHHLAFTSADFLGELDLILSIEMWFYLR